MIKKFRKFKKKIFEFENYEKNYEINKWLQLKYNKKLNLKIKFK